MSYRRRTPVFALVTLRGDSSEWVYYIVDRGSAAADSNDTGSGRFVWTVLADKQMFDKTILRGLLKGLLTAALAASAVACAGSLGPNRFVGYPALLASFSAAGLPAPGTGVVVEQVEAPVQIIGNTYYYMPDATQTHLQRRDHYRRDRRRRRKLARDHRRRASSTARSGYASGISQVDVYEANYWLGNILGVGSPTARPRPRQTIRPSPISVGSEALATQPTTTTS